MRAGHPAEYWRHIRTTNRIENKFATFRESQRQTKGNGSRMELLSMMFKLAESASKHWRLLKGSQVLPNVLQGTTFQDGIQVTHAAIFNRRQHFRCVLDEHGLSHNTIKPHCPEENGIMERANRTFREALDGEELTDLYQARDVMTRIVHWYNHERLHRALGYLRPIDYYRGDPASLHETRRRKMAEARHRRRERNLKLRQPTLPLEPPEGVANHKPKKSHCS